MKSISFRCGGIALSALTAGVLMWGVSQASGAPRGGKFVEQDLEKGAAAVPQVAATPTPTPTATPTPSTAPPPQIDGVGTIAAPSGRRDAQFFIFDVENEQVTPQYLEGTFGYLDKKAHINFATGKIETVTVNGNQAAFTGTARIGGPRSRQIVQFTVTVNVDTNSVGADTFSIVLSNGYSNSGTLTSGRITIHTADPD
jgi:hypothetical protein